MCRYSPQSPEGIKSGTDLAGGYSACLIQLCGDLDYYAKWLNFPRWSNHGKPCGLCKATFRGPYTWLDNRPRAKWIPSTLTLDNWQSHYTTTCPIFKVIGMSGLCVTMDYMHCMFLGWLQYVYGSVMYLLVFTLMNDEPLANLKVIGEFISEYQKTHPTTYKYRLRLDKLTMFVRKKGFPKLRGRACDIMGLHAALLALWGKFMSPGNIQHKQVRYLLQLNHQLANTLDAFSPRYGFMAVPEPQATQLEKWVLAMAQIHSQLLESFEAQGVKVFNLTAKTHFVVHSIMLARHIHPALVWCFKGETTMHMVQRLWKSCLPGTKHWGVSIKAALKHRHLMHLKLQAM
jgi:hypothetical protein